jgi:hypothetical protein
VINLNGLVTAYCFHRPTHGLDIVENFGGRNVRWVLAKASGQLRPEEAAPANLEPFDPRRGNRLSA